MRNFWTIALFALGCGGANTSTVAPTPRPSPAQGGFQAQPPPVTSWVNLGVPVEVTPIERRIDLGGQPGSIGQLMIKGVSGEPEIAQVQVEYMDHSIKRVDINKRFQPGDGQVIELKEDRPIQNIVVFLDPDSQGTFEIFGG